jgi:hypothetical protein
MRGEREAIGLANVKLFVSVGETQGPESGRGRRRDLGAAPPPFTPYKGPTSRSKAQKAAIATTGPGGRRSPTTPKPNGSGREGTSLGNVSRGDRI